MQLLILLDKSRHETLTDQLCDQLRKAIANGRVAKGARLPSSRNLADQLGISRNTVVRAYDALIIEGHLEARPASGIYVWSDDLRQQEPRAPRDPTFSHAPALELASAVDEDLRRFAGTRDRRMMVDFSPDQTTATMFPLKMWRRTIQNRLSHSATTSLSMPTDTAGLAELRVAIAGHQSVANGIIVEPTQVLITGGRLESLNLIARMLLSRDALILMEDPCYLGAHLAFKSTGAKIVPCALDQSGLIVERLPEQTASLIYVTPAHQYPTGATLPAPRRQALVDWAYRNGCMIIEDGYGDEFHDDGAQIQSIAAAAPDSTIYIGGFTTSFGDGLRLGYVIVPARYAEHARLTKALLSGGNPWLEQAVLADLISTGKYASQIARARAHYRATRNILVTTLKRYFGDVTLGGGNAGLQLFWQLPPGVPNARIFEHHARRARIGVYSLESAPVHVDGATDVARRGILLGFGALNERQIEKGISRLSDAVDDALDDRVTEVDQLLVDLPQDRPPIPTAKVRGLPAPAKKNKSALTPAAPPRQRYGRAAEYKDSSPMPSLKNIYQYPVKGLSAQPLSSISLSEGRHFPHDRQFALARPGVPLQADDPKWAKKGLFVMLMLEEALAKVQTHLDPETLQFDVRAGNMALLSVNLKDPDAKGAIEELFHSLVPTLPAPPTLVRSRDGHFMDKPDSVISMINLATVRDLERQWGAQIDPLRFRANIYIDSGKPWEEFEWVESDIQLGDVTFRVDRKNGRCGATNVNPVSGVRDMDIPGSLRKTLGHKDLGVYLKVAKGGTIAIGDELIRPLNASTSRDAVRAARDSVGRQFICRGCYYIYSEDAGLPAEGIAPGTTYQQLPDGYRCPDCGTDKAKLQPHVA